MPCAGVIDSSDAAAGNMWQVVTSAWCRRRRECLDDFGGRPAKRRLFGTCSSEEVREFVQRELSAIREQDQRHYNFDFERMVPLEGRFKWERVEASPPPSALILPAPGSPMSSSSDSDPARLLAASLATPSPKARRRMQVPASPPRQQCTCHCSPDSSSNLVGERKSNLRYCGACGAVVCEVRDAQTSPGLGDLVPTLPLPGLTKISPSSATSQRAFKSRVGRQHCSPDSATGLSIPTQQMKITDFFRSRKRLVKSSGAVKSGSVSPPSRMGRRRSAFRRPIATRSSNLASRTSSASADVGRRAADTSSSPDQSK